MGYRPNRTDNKKAKQNSKIPEKKRNSNRYQNPDLTKAATATKA
jgi:hypothetical protein